MPYITQSKRQEINDCMKDILDYLNNHVVSIGEINFMISNLINFLIRKSCENDSFNYSICNELIGVLECAKLELYRKVIAKYEEKKIQENGSLY